jgi:hypothetical protein
MHAVVSVVRSVVEPFLYMGLKNARRAEHNDLDDALKRAKGFAGEEASRAVAVDGVSLKCDHGRAGITAFAS